MHSWCPDPTDLLQIELAELRGFVKKVPALIQAERDARWEEIGGQPGDPDDDMLDMYERASGSEEGYGFAEWDALTYRTAIVSGWEFFRSTMSDLLESFLRGGASEIPQYAADLLAEEIRRFDRHFDPLVRRYREWGGIDLTKLPEWQAICHILELRNAIVHNHGRYTAKYAKQPLAIRYELFGRALSPADALAANEQIPLTAEHVIAGIDTLESVAMQARAHLLPELEET